MKEMKSCKAPGLDGFPVECLKNGGIAVLERLCWNGGLPMDWRRACIVTLYIYIYMEG